MKCPSEDNRQPDPHPVRPSGSITEPAVPPSESTVGRVPPEPPGGRAAPVPNIAPATRYGRPDGPGQGRSADLAVIHDNAFADTSGTREIVTQRAWLTRNNFANQLLICKKLGSFIHGPGFAPGFRKSNRALQHAVRTDVSRGNATEQIVRLTYIQ